MALFRKSQKSQLTWRSFTGMDLSFPKFLRKLACLFIYNMLRHFAGIRTVWEIKQRTLVDMAVDRGSYIDQSQSLNIHMDQPNFGKLTSLHFYAWSKVCTTFPCNGTIVLWDLDAQIDSSFITLHINADFWLCWKWIWCWLFHCVLCEIINYFVSAF